MKKALIIVGGVVLVLVLIALLLPFVVDADRFRPQVEAQLQSALGRKVTIGKLALAVWSGGVTADGVVIAEDPAYGTSPFLQAKRVSIGVDLMPLVVSRTLNVRTITITEPEIRLLRAPNGKWNYSSLGTKTATKSQSSSSNLSVGRFVIEHGRLVVGQAGARAPHSTYEDVTVDARNIAAGSQVPFELKANTPGHGSMGVEGTVGPFDALDSARTPLDAKLKLSSVDLANTGFLDPAAGLAGILSLDGTMKSDGDVARSEGKATVKGLRLVRGGGPAKDPVTLDYAADYRTQPQTGTLSRGDIRFGQSVAHLTGPFDNHGTSPAVRLKLDGKALPVKDVQGLLPALGVILPAGASLQSGTANANLALDGPVDRMVTSGSVDVQNAKLAGFDLAKKLSVLSALAGLHGDPDTMIQLMSSNLRIAPEGIRTDSLNLTVANIGQITGAGTIGSNNALNFKMLAKLSSANNVVGGISQLATFGQSKGEIPFLISGTTQNPIFMPDVGRAIVGGATAPAQGLGKALGGLFGKKK